MIRVLSGNSIRSIFTPLVVVSLVSGVFAQIDEPAPVVPASLKTIPTRLPDGSGIARLADGTSVNTKALNWAVSDFQAAVRLGKLLFHDMQLGSDGVMACASCHFHAGGDFRVKNQLSPGFDGLFGQPDGSTGGPNSILEAADFPFRKLEVPDDNESPVLSDLNDIASSSGAHAQNFISITPGSDVDAGTPAGDTTFQVAGKQVRQLPGRNSPTNIGGVFLHRMFWDGRASHFFNGKNPLGELDPNARVLVKQNDGTVVEEFVLFNNAALASQADGPPGSAVEMSHAGRSFDDIGRKLLAAQPLRGAKALSLQGVDGTFGQVIDPTDSVLGTMSAHPQAGILPATTTYADLIQQAFDSKLWSGAGDFGGFTHMEKNFSLFFGLSLLAYQSTLRADDTRFDRYMEGGEELGTNSNLLTAQEKEGLDIFMNRGACIACHAGPEFAGAALSDLLPVGAPAVLLERMPSESSFAAGDITMVKNPPVAPFDEDGVAEPADPLEITIPFDPRGKYVEIRKPTGVGGAVAWAFSNFSLAAGQFSPALDQKLPMTAGSSVPNPGAIHFDSQMRIRVRPDGTIRFRVSMGWMYPGLPAGDYKVYVGGAFVGTIPMPAVQPFAIYDNGFYNIGVRQTEEDLGIAGGVDAARPFSLSKRAQLGWNVDGGALQPPVGANERLAVRGAFKTPTIRNIELTGPYMHNGGFATLEQVVDFYVGGAHFFTQNLADLDAEVAGVGGMNPARKAALVAFMKALTDERVRHRSAPFDAPRIFVPHGHVGDAASVADGNADGLADDEFLEVPQTGAAGGAALLTFEELLGTSIAALPETGLAVSEQGQTSATAQIALSRKPTHPVRINLSVNLPGEATVTPSFVEFTPGNWSTPQNLTITAIEDWVVDGDKSIQVITSSPITLDLGYQDLAVANLTVQALDSGCHHVSHVLEAESAQIAAPLVVVADASAQGGHYIHSPEGSGDILSPTGQSGTAVFTVNLASAGTWSIWGLERSPAASSNSPAASPAATCPASMRPPAAPCFARSRRPTAPACSRAATIAPMAVCSRASPRWRSAAGSGRPSTSTPCPPRSPPERRGRLRSHSPRRRVGFSAPCPCTPPKILPPRCGACRGPGSAQSTPSLRSRSWPQARKRP